MKVAVGTIVHVYTAPQVEGLIINVEEGTSIKVDLYGAL